MTDLLFKLKLIFVPCVDNRFRPSFLAGSFLRYSAITLLVLKLIIIPFMVYLPKTAFFADISKAVLIELTNKERISLGLQPLTENPKLAEAANLKANDMLTKDYFAHESPQGINPWYWFKLAGYNYKFAGENLAIGFIDSEEVIDGWLNSPSHRKNLLSPNYSEIGIAAVKGDFEGNETVAVVQLFGNPQATQVTKPVVKTVATTSTEKLAIEPKKEEIKEQEAPATGTQIAGEKTVLSEESSSSEQVAIVSGISNSTKNDLAFSLFYFINSEYYNFLQWLIYGFLVLVIVSLIINIIVRIDIQYKDLIFKALGFAAILLLFISIDKGIIIQLIPHDFKI
jgi:hypothetical protein